MPYYADSPGLRRPIGMDDEGWAEYQFSEEARVELTVQPDPDIYFDEDADAADAEAEEDNQIESEGYEAYLDGASSRDNPYPALHPKRSAWSQGFQQAEADDTGEYS